MSRETQTAFLGVSKDGLRLLFVLLCLPFCYSTAINYSQRPYAPVPFYHDYNTRILSNYNQRLDQTQSDGRPPNARKPYEYTQFYLNTQRENAFNNLYNYVANYRAYLHQLYQSPKFGTIKGYNYVRRRSSDLDSLEKNQTLPDVYSLNFDQSNSNAFLFPFSADCSLFLSAATSNRRNLPY